MLGRLLALGGFFAIGACGLNPSSYRARITVEVDTPQGVQAGSSIVEIQAGKTLALLPDEGKAQVELHGQAVAVDLPGGATLFALLGETKSGHDLEEALTSALVPSYRGGADDFLKAVRELSASDAVGRSAVLNPESYPMLVRFRDVAEPTSVEIVEPAQVGILASATGSIREISVEVTNLPVTRGIEKRLPWLGTSVTNYLDGSSDQYSGDLSNQLNVRNFRRDGR
jgi:hypothetical protein